MPVKNLNNITFDKQIEQQKVPSSSESKVPTPLITNSFSKEPIQKLRIEEIDILAADEINLNSDLAEFAKSVLKGEV